MHHSNPLGASDNAANYLKGIRQGAGTWHYFPLNCLAHSLNLLAKDLQQEYLQQFEQAGAVVTFMSRGQPRLEWEKAKKMLDGTELVRPCETRWGSWIDVIETVVKNRVAILQTCFALRELQYFQGSFRGG